VIPTPAYRRASSSAEYPSRGWSPRSALYTRRPQRQRMLRRPLGELAGVYAGPLINGRHALGIAKRHRSRQSDAGDPGPAPPATKEVTRLRNLIARDIVGTESRSGPWSGAGQSLSGIWACSFPTSSKAKRRFRRFSSCTSLRTSAALQESVPYEVSFDLDALQGRATDHADRMNSSASPPIRAASWTSRTG
jgi:hypothetical protein